VVKTEEGCQRRALLIEAPSARRLENTWLERRRRQRVHVWWCGSVRRASIETRNVTKGGDQCCGVRRLMCLADVDQHSTALHGMCIGEADAAMTRGGW
jgi:hypothetical protein